MKKPRKAEHPEILVERAGSSIFDKAFTHLTNKFGEDIGLSSAHIATVAERVGLTNFVQDNCNKVQFYSLYSWWKNGKPIYKLTEDLTMALTYTDPPMEVFTLNPRECIPISGMYIGLPPVFYVGNTADDERYAIEGIYLVNDLVCPEVGAEPEHGIVILGVGEDLAKGAWLDRVWNEGPCRDDTLIYFSIMHGRKIEYLTDGEGADILGSDELSKLALNLLWMLHYVPYAISKEVLPDSKLKGKKDRALRREMERLGRKGRTHRGYTLLDLASKPSKEASVGTSTVRAHVVRGHVHHYWVNDPKGLEPVLTKKVGDKIKYLIPKWVLPYKKGK